MCCAAFAGRRQLRHDGVVGAAGRVGPLCAAGASAFPPRPAARCSSRGCGTPRVRAVLAHREDRSFRMARRQPLVSAVGDEVEYFEHRLPDQDLAPRGSDDGLGSGGEVSDLDCDVGHRSLFRRSSA